MSIWRRLRKQPVLVLLGLALAAGLFVFRDYGLTWDEPLFYDYGEALSYAYSPANWLSGTFDLAQSYGPSAEDHKTRGPAYLLLGSVPAHFLQQAGLDRGSSWHLLNFATFLLGVFFVYGMCRWFVQEPAAVVAAALFASQPLLWGHAFINPKDMPFLVLMAGSVWLGVRMADRLTDVENPSLSRHGREMILPAIFLGLASGNRILGPFGGLLVAAYLLARRPARRTFLFLGCYLALAFLVMFATWPYLWESPARFLEVFGLMAQNPTILPVLFADSVYRAYELPRRYLAFYLAVTLTEVVWPLFVVGLAAAAFVARLRNRRLLLAGVLVAWLVVPVAYAILLRPPMYDGMRHFLFVLPPVFVGTALGLEAVFRLLSNSRIRAALAISVLAPGLASIVTLHPYEYAYFNAYVGGTGGAFRHYETEYWLTCYKETVEDLNDRLSAPARLFVHREPEVAAPYAGPNLEVLPQRGNGPDIRTGDLVLVNTRTNEDRQTFHDAPELFSVGRAGAIFCIVKAVP